MADLEAVVSRNRREPLVEKGGAGGGEKHRKLSEFQ